MCYDRGHRKELDMTNLLKSLESSINHDANALSIVTEIIEEALESETTDQLYLAHSILVLVKENLDKEVNIITENNIKSA